MTLTCVLRGVADSLLEQGELDRGLTCVESFDYDIVDKICIPFDNLALRVILNGDGSQDKRVISLERQMETFLRYQKMILLTVRKRP